MSKYHAKRVKDCPHCGQTHDSLSEAAYCTRLHLLVRAGEDGIVHIDVHPVASLPGGLRWALDFAVYRQFWEQEPAMYELHTVTLSSRLTVRQWIDVKGFETEGFRIKRKLFDSTHPDAPLKVVKRKGKSWVEI